MPCNKYKWNNFVKSFCFCGIDGAIEWALVHLPSNQGQRCMDRHGESCCCSANEE